MEIPAGTRFASYEIDEALGAGGMGEVYRARDPRIGRDVAIKILRAATAADPDRLSRFQQEAHAAGILNHPNLLTIFDLGTADSTPYIASELLEGETLRDRMHDSPVAARRSLDYAVQIANGLAAAHDKGIVHRDLKPENIFVCRDGRVKILDFGLAKLRPSLAEYSDVATVRRDTDPGTVLGTAGYMSPEQVRGESVDHRSDIFSFGAILYEMLSGGRAFNGDTNVEIMSAVLRHEPPEIIRATPPVHPAVDRTIRHCLEKDPLERFQSTRDLKFQLEMAAEGLYSGTETTRAYGSPFRRRWLMALLIALSLIALSLPLLLARLSAKREPPAYKRLTFRSGAVGTARFSSDGRTVVYGAAWEDNPSEIFVSRVDSSDARPLGIGSSELLAVAKNGE